MTVNDYRRKVRYAVSSRKAARDQIGRVDLVLPESLKSGD